MNTQVIKKIGDGNSSTAGEKAEQKERTNGMEGRERVADDIHENNNNATTIFAS
jgi:hypothetical protein